VEGCALTSSSRTNSGQSRRWAWVSAAAIGLLGLAAVLTTQDYATRPAPQPVWTKDTIADRAGLPMGDIYYRPSARVVLGEHYQVSLWVCGRKSSCPPMRKARPTPRPSGPAGSATEPIPIGARLKANLTASDDTRVRLRSQSADQLVLTEADAAEWLWRVEPVSSGEVALRGGFVVLRGNTQEPLFSEKTIEMRLRVDPKPRSFGERARQFGSGLWSVTDKALATGGALATLVATGWGIRALFKRKKKKKKAAR
jgi:hypothetical protein